MSNQQSISAGSTQKPIGEWTITTGQSIYVRKHPDLYERIIAEGHQVGNHTHNHIQGLTHSIKEYSYNVEKANTYIKSHYVRPPHGWMRLAQYAWLSRKYKIVMWDVVTRDYSKWMTAEDIVANVKRLPESLRWLRDEGYAFKVFP